jgi:hypothetical protein
MKKRGGKRLNRHSPSSDQTDVCLDFCGMCLPPPRQACPPIFMVFLNHWENVSPATATKRIHCLGTGKETMEDLHAGVVDPDLGGSRSSSDPNNHSGTGSEIAFDFFKICVIFCKFKGKVTNPTT